MSLKFVKVTLYSNRYAKPEKHILSNSATLLASKQVLNVLTDYSKLSHISSDGIASTTKLIGYRPIRKNCNMYHTVTVSTTSKIVFSNDKISRISLFRNSVRALQFQICSFVFCSVIWFVAVCLRFVRYIFLRLTSNQFGWSFLVLAF